MTDDIIRMARVAGWHEAQSHDDCLACGVFDLYRFAKLVAEHEREECAKVLDEMAAKDKLSNYYKVAALTIRERGAP